MQHDVDFEKYQLISIVKVRVSINV